jgi:hypothetical protein
MNNRVRRLREVPLRHHVYRPCVFLTQLGDLQQKNVSARRGARAYIPLIGREYMRTSGLVNSFFTQRVTSCWSRVVTVDLQPFPGRSKTGQKHGDKAPVDARRRNPFRPALYDYNHTPAGHVCQGPPVCASPPREIRSQHAARNHLYSETAAWSVEAMERGFNLPGRNHAPCELPWNSRRVCVIRREWRDSCVPGMSHRA